MGAYKDIEIEKTNSQQEAGERTTLTQEQREAINKAVALVSKAMNALTTIAERLTPTIQRTAELLKELAQQAQARLKHQRAIQGLKKHRKKGRRQGYTMSMRYKAYIFKGIAKPKSSR